MDMPVSTVADDNGVCGEILKPNINFYLNAKRFIDVTVCIVAAPAALLFVALAACVIFVSMGRPIFFSQERTGFRGSTFLMRKLRTMRASSSSDTATATSVEDPRITVVGALLRRTHIDEIPQLWNVMRGEMTLIGPRPEQPKLVEQYRLALPDYDRRHLVKPGLSGWAQVRYGYAADLYETKIKLHYDLHYLDNIGPRIDLKIVVLTAMVFMKKRYVR